MKIIYHCYGSAHSSIVAAAIHLNKLPSERNPTYQEIMKVDDFDRARDDSIGHLYYRGSDRQGNEIYTMGMGRETNLVKNSILSLVDLYGYSEDVFFAFALPNINSVAKIGGALSRRFGFVKLGRYLAAIGICQSYQQLLTFVDQTKRDVLIKKNTRESVD